MTSQQFRVQQVDHIELYVPEQYEAARWYERVLGLEIMRDVEFWAAEGGPLMLSSDGGSTKLALFQGEPPGFAPPTGFQRVAFRVTGDGFFRFLDTVDKQAVEEQAVKEQTVFTNSGEPVHALEVIDHDVSYSVYFCDPYGNRYEVTTYDYAYVSDRLAQSELTV